MENERLGEKTARHIRLAQRGAVGGTDDGPDLQHHVFLLTLDGKLHKCPAGRDKPVKRVLDAGCGTGIWSIDYGKRPDGTR